MKSHPPGSESCVGRQPAKPGSDEPDAGNLLVRILWEPRGSRAPPGEGSKGSKAKGSKAKGSKAKGSKAKGSKAKGSKAKGSKAKGSKAKGSRLRTSGAGSDGV